MKNGWGNRILRFTVTGALIVSAPIGVVACGGSEEEEELHVNPGPTEEASGGEETTTPAEATPAEGEAPAGEAPAGEPADANLEGE